MIKVSHLVKFVQELKPQSTPTRLSFFNFIKNMNDPEALLTPEVIDQFFVSALDYSHWYSHRAQLGHEVELLLENFNSYFQNQFPIHLVRFPQTIQIVEIEQNNDWNEAISQFLKRLCGPNDRFKLMVDPLKRGIGLILRQDGHLEVRFFDRKMTFRSGLLEPLRKDLVLYYNPQLELSSDHIHKFDLAPQMTVQFEVDGPMVTGTLVRGYFFQKMQSFEKSSWTDLPKLFTQLKKIEQLFVDRQTDNYYIDLKNQLEKAIQQVLTGEKDSREWIQYLLSQAELACDQIYTDDNTMSRLVKDLRSHLNKEVGQHHGSNQKINSLQREHSK